MENFPNISPILRNFTQFHEISWFSPNFGVLAPRRGHVWVLTNIVHAFKAKKVTFWEVCSDFAWFSLFSRKIDFPWNFMKFCKNSISGPQKLFFSALGLQKSSQNVVFIKGFAPGAPGSHFGRKRGLLGSKTPKWAEFHVLGPKRGSLPPKRVNVHKRLSIS